VQVSPQARKKRSFWRPRGLREAYEKRTPFLFVPRNRTTHATVKSYLGLGGCNQERGRTRHPERAMSGSGDGNETDEDQEVYDSMEVKYTQKASACTSQSATSCERPTDTTDSEGIGGLVKPRVQFDAKKPSGRVLVTRTICHIRRTTFSDRIFERQMRQDRAPTTRDRKRSKQKRLGYADPFGAGEEREASLAEGPSSLEYFV